MQQNYNSKNSFILNIQKDGKMWTSGLLLDIQIITIWQGGVVVKLREQGRATNFQYWAEHHTTLGFRLLFIKNGIQTLISFLVDKLYVFRSPYIPT